MSSELGNWRGKTLAKVRETIHEADLEIVEEWMGTPVWSHGSIVCTGGTFKKVVKMTFAKGAAFKDPSGLFNSSLDGNVRRAIDIHEGDKVDEAAPSHAQQLFDLPREPFDRMLIATAVAESIPLFGGDVRFPAYQQHGLCVIWK